MNKKFGQKLELIIKFFNQAEKYFMAKVQSLAVKLEKTGWKEGSILF